MSSLPSNYRDRVVCVVGLGYVGLTLAVTMAEVGFAVIGVERRPGIVEALRQGKPHFHEPGIKEMLDRSLALETLRVEQHIPRDCEAGTFIITVGTPLDEAGRVRLDMVTNATREVAERLTDGAMVVLRSTVKLGVTRTLVVPILRETGKTFDLAFCPERTIEGLALRELRSLPQIVGGYDFESTARAAQMFGFITPTVVKVSTLEVAETIKLVDNVQRDVMFGFSNEIARFCDASGVNAAEVIKAGKLGYPRTNLFMPGPVGGPCLSKDPYILFEGLRPFRIEPEIAVAARKTNERQLVEVAEYVAAVLRASGCPQTATITLLGVAFKGRPETDDLRGTTAGPVLQRLRELFPRATFRGYDPVVSEDEVGAFGLEPCENLDAAFRCSNAVLVMNNHPRFASMPLVRLAEGMSRPGFIYDLWNNFSAKELALPKGVGYEALGAHVDAVLPNVSAAAEAASGARPV